MNSSMSPCQSRRVFILAARRVFVLGAGAFGGAALAVIEPVAAAGVLADAVLMIEADVEPNRRVEGAVLIQTEPGKLLVKHFAVFGAEIAVVDAPVGNGAADAVKELANGRFALGGVLLAIKIFRDNDLRGERRPGLRH